MEPVKPVTGIKICGKEVFVDSTNLNLFKSTSLCSSSQEKIERGQTQKEITPESCHTQKESTPESGQTQKESTPECSQTLKESTAESSHTQKESKPESSHTQKESTPESGQTQKDSTAESSYTIFQELQNILEEDDIESYNNLLSCGEVKNINEKLQALLDNQALLLSYFRDNDKTDKQSIHGKRVEKTQSNNRLDGSEIPSNIANTTSTNTPTTTSTTNDIKEHISIDSSQNLNNSNLVYRSRLVDATTESIIPIISKSLENSHNLSDRTVVIHIHNEVRPDRNNDVNMVLIIFFIVLSGILLNSLVHH
jgi:hypothetical protein